MTTIAASPLPLRDAFAAGADYLATCTVGVLPLATRDALIADAMASADGHADPVAYSAATERARAHFAALVGTLPERVAIGSQTSAFTSLIAAALPAGAEVVVPEGDFSSLLLPFAHAPQGLRVRAVPLRALADAIGPETSLVAFSLVQSATGEVADLRAITEAAHRHGARTLCDGAQAVGWMPVDATQVDALVCHAYKWLCAPRGVAFLALSESFAREIPPLQAGWYAGADPWSSCYGHEVHLADDATRFDVSPAWPAFFGAEQSLALFASADARASHAHTTALAAAFREAIGVGEPAIPSAIVSWPDPDGRELARLTNAGIIASGRAGRARVGFHVYNDERDVERAVRALRA
ncbi:aminotransferase class V-fold PLP-dependent enzyme [Microbacterium stercoris]|uniref:Aminotransferase class V-fold PLP-dependent enzyme n=1 Tax=Microbacterium stercoris TaxID=2820289 RepID=A0A939QJM3_9MICO|nr:aminotransferase class V-fold PLP-dependent enzyme [Microbacterium stercoris]MBO3663894.1 aminotransferase class V-fold PLP-dependent enzyme [Microbacterium stercoris]